MHWRALQHPAKHRPQALRREVEFWRQWLATRGLEWPEEYVYRFDPNSEVSDPVLRRVLTALPRDEVDILDVGAGPASIVGHRFPPKSIAITAVDPLADEYDVLLREAGAIPPVRTIPGSGEELLERFGTDAFDIVYSRNALDHSVEPIRIIDAMLAVVRRGGHVVLRHVRNEAIRQRYDQLHQWNFDEREGHFFISRRRGKDVNVTESLRDRAHVECLIERSDYEWITCDIQKL
jgi:SAM-dependent methyltransferase